MKKIFIIMTTLFGIIFSQNVQIDNIRAVGQIPNTAFSDIWGYTAPDGHEFALAGKSDGTSIIDISTNPHNPTEVGFIPGETSTWRDLKVHGHYCYVTNETGGGIDIISLEDPFNPYKVGSYTSSTPTAHNLFIADGYAYIVGSGGAGGGTNAWQGIIILELSDPENPTEVSRWEEAYIHDVYVKNDTAYACGIYIGSLFIIDVSDKTNPTTMVEHNYSNYGCHAVWVTENSRYVVTADEENGGFVYIFDIQDFDNINMVATWYPDEPEVQNKTVHNVLIKEDLLYVSYYVYGTRIVDISDPYNPTEVGYYDWYPGQDGLYSGNWGVYPFTENGLIYSTDYTGDGLFVMSYPYMGEVEFEELNDTEDTSSPISLDVEIEESADYSIDYNTLQLFWGLNGVITESAMMSASGGNNYSGSITPSGEVGIMQYYVAFETISGSRVTKPYGAPFSTFSFNIGSDHIAPEIISVDQYSGSIQRNGQRKIQTFVQDNLGISSVKLFYSLDGNNWQENEMSHVQSNGNSEIYESDIEWDNIPIPSVISYYIECVDIAQVANTTVSSVFEFQIGYFEIVDDFESGLENWDTGLGWGLSVFGFDGSLAVHDSPNGNYENNQTTSLTLTYPYDLSPYSQARLVFSHMYLTWPNQDYCFVEVSVDSINWTVVTEYSGWQGFSIIEELDFTPWTGQGNETVYLRFTLESSSAQTADGWHIDNITWETTPSLDIENQLNIPTEIFLHDAYPNPFNPTTVISYYLPQAGFVNLKVYDLMGREIRNLTSGFENAGMNSAMWDAKDNQGNIVSSGVYIYRLEAAGQAQSNKLILLK